MPFISASTASSSLPTMKLEWEVRSFRKGGRHIQGRSLPLYAGRSAVVRARVEQVVVGGDVFPGPMPVKLSSGCSKLFYLDKMSFRLRESAVLAGLDQGEWFHEFVCLSLDKA